MKNKYIRPDWNDYFLDITKVVSNRSSCLRRRVGAIAVSPEHRILATGYNGAPPGMKHCSERGGCIREQLNIESGTQQNKCYSVHAEENLILQAALNGVSLRHCTIYCTHQPCIMCIRKIIGLQPTSLYYLNEYPDVDAISLISEVATETRTVGDESLHHWKFK